MLLTPKQTAATLAIGRTTVYELLAQGKLTSVLIGRCRRIPYAAVRGYVESLHGASDTAPPTPPETPRRSQRSTKMSRNPVGRRSAPPAGLLIEALHLPFAADEAAHEAAAASHEER